MPHNCKAVPIITVVVREQTKTSKALRKVVRFKQYVYNVLNIPRKTEVKKLSDKKAGEFLRKKDLTTNIVTEHRHYKKVVKITVKTDINLRYLLPIED
jgi:hypothetical protein